MLNFSYKPLSFNIIKFHVSEKGAPVALKELFDRTHMKKTKDGMGYYCNKRSQDVMVIQIYFTFNLVGLFCNFQIVSLGLESINIK